jgi:hypothetical protein
MVTVFYRFQALQRHTLMPRLASLAHRHQRRRARGGPTFSAGPFSLSLYVAHGVRKSLSFSYIISAPPHMAPPFQLCRLSATAANSVSVENEMLSGPGTSRYSSISKVPIIVQMACKYSNYDSFPRPTWQLNCKQSFLDFASPPLMQPLLRIWTVSLSAPSPDREGSSFLARNKVRDCHADDLDA